MKRILVPCDFSKSSKEAFYTAAAIARKSHGTVTVLHVMFPQTVYDPAFLGDPMVIPPSAEFIESLQEDARREFEGLKSSLGKDAPAAELEIQVGGLLDSIQTITKSKKIDLVVMGTSGTSGLEEIVIGSNTERVVRFLKVPVLAVRAAPAIDTITNILLPTTGALDQHHFIAEVKALQYFFRARLHVLLVNTPATFRSEVEGNELLQDFVKHYQLEDYELHFKNYFHEDEGIIDFAAKNGMNLIAMATHARKGLSHLFSGSITEDVVNHTYTPTWTLCLDTK